MRRLQGTTHGAMQLEVGGGDAGMGEGSADGDGGQRDHVAQWQDLSAPQREWLRGGGLTAGGIGRGPVATGEGARLVDATRAFRGQEGTGQVGLLMLFPREIRDPGGLVAEPGA